MARKGDSASGTGDINFAAACMAMGIPLNQERPATAVKCETGRDYCRFFLEGMSIDGEVSLAWCDKAWRHRSTDLEGAMEPFGWIMEFIQEKPAGVRSSRDWLTWAHDFLRQLGMGASWTWPRRLEDLADFVGKHATSRAGYVFAFVSNRMTCLETATMAAEDPRLLLNKDRDFTMVRDKAPAHRKKAFFRDIG